MKKCWILLTLVLLLSGCSAQETFETVSDDFLLPVTAEPKRLQLVLPEEAAVQTMQSNEEEKIYLCDGYTLTTHCLAAGDLNSTFRQLTGHTPDQLTVMQTECVGTERYETVWSAVGEGGDQVGRALILDDGNYHYAVTVMASSALSGALTDTWGEIFDSVTLGTD